MSAQLSPLGISLANALNTEIAIDQKHGWALMVVQTQYSKVHCDGKSGFKAQQLQVDQGRTQPEAAFEIGVLGVGLGVCT